MTQRFRDQTVILTGASRGIGAAMALAFAREGATLFLGCSRKSDEQAATDARIALAGGRARWVPGDITGEAASKALCAAALEDTGRVDVAVANAGLSHFAPFASAQHEDLDRLIGVNQLGVYYLLRNAARPMKKQKRGVVLVVSSTFAADPPKMNALYAGTKAFAETVTRGFAREHAVNGIRANVLAPGATDTDMNRITATVSPKALAASTGFGRLARPEEVAEAALFLCSEEATYISGQTLTVNAPPTGSP